MVVSEVADLCVCVCVGGGGWGCLTLQLGLLYTAYINCVTKARLQVPTDVASQCIQRGY